ncbi:MAG: hypothetical protein PUC82_03465 [bacterium]|nr:hypothetical protein [bacterium]
MSSNLVSHDTDKMRNWSNTMNSNSSDYRNLIDELYALIADFANSNIFKGGLATDLSTNIEEQKSEYLRYETLFNEAADILKSRSQKIDSDEAYLQNRIRNNNPMGM